MHRTLIVIVDHPTKFKIILVRVPTKYGKADLSLYKKAGNAVVDILKKRASACEKRSVDEVAIEITEEADRLLASREWIDILHTAMEVSLLADDVHSMAAATISKKDTRMGHKDQAESSGNPLNTSTIKEVGTGWTKMHSFIERRLIAGAVVVSELRAQV
jgi:hypothetical protein